MSDTPALTELERELLELISMPGVSGEPTTMFDEEMLENSPGRAVVEATLRELLARGLLITERPVNAGPRRRRSDGATVYEDDWWVLTRAGRAAIGQTPHGTEI